MGISAIILGTTYIGSLLLAFCLGGLPAEIVIAIPGLLYLTHS